MRSLRTAALVLAAGCLFAAPVSARQKKVPPAPVDPAVAAVVQQLHQAAKLLDEANHDYDGHRAKAEHEVHKAIHALHPAHRHPHLNAPAGPRVKEPAMKEDQKVSDAQLDKALQILQTLQPSLASSSTPHVQKAAVDVAAAITEIKAARAIK
jgi:hypothetical protein